MRKIKFKLNFETGKPSLVTSADILGEEEFKRSLLENIGVTYNKETLDEDLSTFLPTFYPETVGLTCLGVYYQPSSPFCKQCTVRKKCLSGMVNNSRLWKKRKTAKTEMIRLDQMAEAVKDEYLDVLDKFDSSQKFLIKRGVSVVSDGFFSKISKKIIENYVFSVKAKDVVRCVKEELNEDVSFNDVIAYTMYTIDSIIGKVLDEV